MGKGREGKRREEKEEAGQEEEDVYTLDECMYAIGGRYTLSLLIGK